MQRHVHARSRQQNLWCPVHVADTSTGDREFDRSFERALGASCFPCQPRRGFEHAECWGKVDASHVSFVETPLEIHRRQSARVFGIEIRAALFSMCMRARLGRFGWIDVHSWARFGDLDDDNLYAFWCVEHAHRLSNPRAEFGRLMQRLDFVTETLDFVTETLAWPVTWDENTRERADLLFSDSELIFSYM